MSLHATGEPTEAWCAEVAQLLADLVGPWQALVSRGVRRRGPGGRQIAIVHRAGGRAWRNSVRRCTVAEPYVSTGI